MAFLSLEQLERVGFKQLGLNVQVSDKASIYNPAAISIGDHSRIDDFCVLSAGEGGIEIGRYVHIACFCSLIGQGTIVMEDFSGLSSRVAIYSSSDDYNGVYMTNPTLPDGLRRVIHGPVRLGKHVVIGVGSAVMPKVTLGAGAAVAAFSFVKTSVEAFTVVGGVPARKIKMRSAGLLELEKVNF